MQTLRSSVGAGVFADFFGCRPPHQKASSLLVVSSGGDDRGRQEVPWEMTFSLSLEMSLVPAKDCCQFKSSASLRGGGALAREASVEEGRVARPFQAGLQSPVGHC